MRLLFSTSIVLLLILASWSSAVGAGRIVMIGAAVPFDGADLALKERVEALGFTVTEHSQDEDDPVDITGAVGVIIGEALGSGNVADGYKDVPIPVIITEAYVMDDMKLAAGDFNTAPDTTLTIVDSAHPIAGGLSGDVDIATEAFDVCSVSEILGDAQVVATVKSTGHTALAAYEAGAGDQDGNPLPARRVFVFLFEGLVPVLTDPGWGLVERSVLWALDMASPVSPEGAAAVTWGELKADYR